RCNNYTVLQSIPCSFKCKIIRQILLDHPLSYALTATADVHVVYLQQFLRTVSKVHGPEETIKFMVNTQQFVHAVDMFRDILQLPVETPDNLFVALVNIKAVEVFMNKVGYQAVVDKFVHAVDMFRDILQLPVETPDNLFVALVNIKAVEVFMNKVGYQAVVDKTKINILQLLHAVINRTNADYATLLWLEPGSHKDKPEYVYDDDDNRGAKKVDEEEGGEKGSLETRTEETQATIPTSPRSPKTILYSDKNITQELMETVPLPTTSTSYTSHSKR
nr:hypothetical protein [Tanacetum cinerariifolium]